MRGKWAAGIPPRNFTWIIRDHLAMSERPGGAARTHRPVRRKEELIWLRIQGFNRVVSLLPSPHNLRAYEEEGIAYDHYALHAGVDPRVVLTECYDALDRSLTSGERVLVHRDELGDEVMGVAAGYLVWSKRVTNGPHAVALIEHLVGHQMGPGGRELVVVVDAIGPSRPS